MSDETQDRTFRILRNEKRKLPCKLNQEEFRAAAKRAAAIADEIANTDREIEGYQSTVKGLKARKETLEVERSGESRKVRLEQEDRDVDVVIEIEDGTNTVYERRADTNEVLKERGPTVEETQVSLFHEVRQTRPDPEAGDPVSEAKDVTPKALTGAVEPEVMEPKKKSKDKRKKKQPEPTIDDLDVVEEEVEEDGDIEYGDVE